MAEDSDRMRILAAPSLKLQRPETDYERWLRKQDKHFQPGNRPLYGPGLQDSDTLEETGNSNGHQRDGGERSLPHPQKQPKSHGDFLRPPRSRDVAVLEQPLWSSIRSPSHHSLICTVILSVLLAVIFVKSTRAFRKRRQRRSALVLPENTSDEKRLPC
ncbi:hypothetical protein BDV28DRAFT_42746 [Aspergillus coremiiformis]|uniref:Uncharacterized protein n=1 Tax=Aspergillus coremiiformis TaxID=138285 RepID=A0A5N6ZCW5_9EURO|nr:hypothetical protein BDV28DRAFT_42746 [Aspergillus coremiiformis]